MRSTVGKLGVRINKYKTVFILQYVDWKKVIKHYKVKVLNDIHEINVYKWVVWRDRGEATIQCTYSKKYLVHLNIKWIIRQNGKYGTTKDWSSYTVNLISWIQNKNRRLKCAGHVHERKIHEKEVARLRSSKRWADVRLDTKSCWQRETILLSRGPLAPIASSRNTYFPFLIILFCFSLH